MNPTALLAQTGHRPWPLPRLPWVMMQSWRDLLFAHWPIPPDVMRSHIPAPLEVDTFEGTAWLALAPFRITGLRPRILPPFPGTADFLEMNLRTYVRLDGGRPGILFFTLEAASRTAVAAARALYHLPYRFARMSMHDEGGWIRYASEREYGDAAFRGRYRAAGSVTPPPPGSLEHFLTERYALFAPIRGGRVIGADIHHPPWPLQVAEAEIELNTLPAAHGFDIAGPPSLLHFSARQDTLVWPPRRVA